MCWSFSGALTRQTFRDTAMALGLRGQSLWAPTGTGNGRCASSIPAPPWRGGPSLWRSRLPRLLGAIRSDKAGKWLINFVSEAFETLPEPDNDGLIEIEALLNSLKSIVKKYSRIFSAFDTQGLRCTLNELNVSIKGRRVVLNDAVEIIKDYMKDIRIMCDSPAPGRIHFTTYNQAAWIDREHIFLVGLGADNFPGMATEDPLLLDNERESPPLRLSTDKINKNIKTMTAFLENISGNLTCSYSSYDTVEIREIYPSTLYYRLKEKFPQEETTHIGFVLNNKERFLDDNDFWTYSGMTNNAVIRDEVETTGPSEPQAVWNYTTEEISGVELTATSISDYAECKYKFFLKHVLRLKEIKSDEFDALGWLSALETGNLYHKIFEGFVLQMLEAPDFLQNKTAAMAFMHKLVEDEIAIFERELPTASEFHTEKQRKEIHQNAVKFVEYEISEAGKRKPLFVEFPFGEAEPVIIEIGKGRKIHASGYIDRIDQISDGSIEVMDYKTGSTYKFQNLQSPQAVGIDDANAQLVLYYLVLNELKQSGQTAISNIQKLYYRFPTAKGEYEIISLPLTDKCEEYFKAAFLEIVKEIETGVFTPQKGKVRYSDEKELVVDCKFCGFANVCKYVAGGAR